jgi:hypothetical protein
MSQPATDGADREDLSEKAAERDQRAGDYRLDAPRPNRHRGKAEGEIGEALNKTAGRHAEGYEGEEMVQGLLPACARDMPPWDARRSFPGLRCFVDLIS